MSHSSAYHDPGLRIPVSIDGSWDRPVEIVTGGRSPIRRTLYIHSHRNVSYRLMIPELKRFALRAPEVLTVKPGVNTLTIDVSSSRDGVGTEELLLRYVRGDVERRDDFSYTKLDFASWDGYASGGYAKKEQELRLEMSLFDLPSGDERFNTASPLDNPAKLTDLIAQGMGYVDAAYRETVVRSLANQFHPYCLWAVNKHYHHHPLYGPLRFARLLPEKFGYTPPGLNLYPPNIRRLVFARAFEITRQFSTRRGLYLALRTLGMNSREISIEHDSPNFTWNVTLPSTALGIFSLDFFGKYLLYHVDAFHTVTVKLTDEGYSTAFTNLHFTGSFT